MCGIAGILGFRTSVPSGLSKRMTATLTHRGPDFTGTWSEPEVALSHTRLKVIDLSDASNQPMLSSCGRYVITFNGEIYNFMENKRKLETNGVRFQTSGDTEVLLALFIKHGPECLQLLKGMFAFCIYDRREKTFFLARDRMGEKPLVYAVVGDKFLFASEIKALLATGLITPEMSEEGLAHYMASGTYIPAPYTMFKGIKKLPPACFMQVNSEGKIRTEKYWHLRFDRKTDFRSIEEASERYTELFAEVVKLQLTSDLPVACMLSGGLDSSSVAAVAKELSPDLRCYVVGSGEDDPEVARARLVASRIASELDELAYNETSRLQDAMSVVEMFDEPFNLFPALYAEKLYRKIKKQHTVLLCGNGADETFAGYGGYNRVVTREPLRQMVHFLTKPLGPLESYLASRASNRISLDLLRLLAERHSLPKVHGRKWKIDALRKMHLFMSKQWRETLSPIDVESVVRDNVQDTNPSSALEAKLAADLLVNHIHSTVMIADGCGMKHALEIRSPFLDHHLIEFAASLPLRILMPEPRNSLRNKEIIRFPMRGRLPDEILDARKMGFGYGIKWSEWVRRRWAGQIRRLLVSGWLASSGMVEIKKIEFILDRNERGSKSMHDIIWWLLNLELWGRKYIAGETVDFAAV